MSAVDLWPFQVEAKEALRANMRRGIRRQVLCSPTGSGKTECAMSIIEDALARGSRALFIADRQTLVLQTSERFGAAGIPHGVIMGNQTRGLYQAAQIASAQTLEKRGFELANGSDTNLFAENGRRPVDLAIVDECHEVRQKVIDYLTESDIPTIGLSATPFAPALGKHYQAVVNVTTTNKLVRDGYLAPLQIVYPEKEVNVDGLSVNSMGEWVREEVSERVKVIVGDIIPEWERRTNEFYGGPVKTIGFCASVDDSELTAEKFREAGHDFRVVHYRQTANEKQAIIDRFRQGEHIGLISCIALTKGFDVPETRILIDASPLRKSLTLHLQKLGRVMRRADGKDFGLVIDHSGNWIGFYGQTQAFLASGCHELGDEKMSKATRQKREDAPVRICQQCRLIIPIHRRTCPNCGAHRIRKHRETVVVEPGPLNALDSIDGSDGSFDGDWWTEICAYATGFYPNDPERARRNASAKYYAIFNQWPRGQFRPIARDPHPIVKAICDKNYRRWKSKQKAKERKQQAKKRAEKNAVQAPLHFHAEAP